MGDTATIVIRIGFHRVLKRRHNQFLRFIGSGNVLPVRYGILCGLNEDWVAADRLDPFDRAVGSDPCPEPHYPGNLQSPGQVRIDRIQLAQDFATVLGYVGSLRGYNARCYRQQR